jgi:hypothetical protein
VIFFDRLLKNTQISDFMKIRPVGAEMFRADRQTDMTKLTVTFRNFSDAPKNVAAFMYACRLLELNLTAQLGRAVFQAVSRQPVTAEVQVLCLAISSGICGGHSDTGTGFP